MNAEQLVESVRKHAKTVLLPSVAQAIVEELEAQEAQHPDDYAVDRFSDALKAKLAQARAKGRSGWQDPAWTPAQISQALRQHVEKGDPCDVANYCMFLWARGARIEPAQEAQPAAWRFRSFPWKDWQYVECSKYSPVYPWYEPVYTFPPDAAKRVAELESSYQASIKSLRKDLESQAKIIGEITRKAQEKIAELEEELAEARKDAQRYRWLRHGDNDEAVMQRGMTHPWLPRNEKLDAIIDAAIAKEKSND